MVFRITVLAGSKQRTSVPVVGRPNPIAYRLRSITVGIWESKFVLCESAFSFLHLSLGWKTYIKQLGNSSPSLVFVLLVSSAVFIGMSLCDLAGLKQSRRSWYKIC